MRTLLVTGAAGFIGTNFVRMLCHSGESVRVVAYDKLTYAGNLANIQDLIDQRKIVFIRGDVCDAQAVTNAVRRHGVTDIVHFAAESHVDRSIHSAQPFIQTNIVGMQVMLDVARTSDINRFVLVSTDEVCGSLPENRPDLKFTENTPLAPNSPYSASKAAADCLARAAFHTFGLPVIIARCCNAFGPYQFPEKLIPLFVTNLIEKKKLPLYGDGMNIRDWMYVADHCTAIWKVLTRGRPGEIYNVSDENEVTNRRMTEIILSEMGCSWDDWVQPVADRLGHDRRYANHADKIRTELGWSPQHPFEQAMKQTIAWYRGNQRWWQAIRTGEYVDYYQRQYGT